MEKDISTEEKIKNAARKVFHEKGYGQARTRDIAEEAGINLALLNYYFRSKEKLFDIIMKESLQEMFGLIVNLVNAEDINLSDKIDMIVARYIDSISKNPNLPLFVLSEIQANPHKIIENVGLKGKSIANNFLFKQIQEQIDKKGIKGVTPTSDFYKYSIHVHFPYRRKAFINEPACSFRRKRV